VSKRKEILHFLPRMRWKREIEERIERLQHQLLLLRRRRRVQLVKANEETARAVKAAAEED